MDYTGGLSPEEIRRIDRIMDLEWMEFAEGWEWHALNYVNPLPPMIPYPSYCVSRRCGWCRFTIKPGDLITARASGGTETVAFELCDSFNDEKLHATFRRCTSDHESCATIGYHVECSEIASSFGLDKRAFVQVARYSYEPSVQEDERRREWILNHLHQIMSKKFTNLPPEILLMVSKYLVLHYAIASLSHVSRSRQCTIEPLKDVWATHLVVDGVEYVASLSNMPKPGSRLIWRESMSQEKTHLFISEDHLGIRQIVNDPGAVTSQQGSPGWWRTLPITSKVLSFSDDGLKLRSFAAAPLNPTICWPHPMAPDALKNMAYHVTKDSSSSLGMTIEARMVALEFNEPEIMGYSACWYKDQLVDLHTHKAEESLAFYRELDEMAKQKLAKEKSDDSTAIPSPYWTYHPLNAGERVEQVWLRTKKEADGKDTSEDERRPKISDTSTEITISLVTNQSRTLTIGRNSSPHSEWKCISKDSTESPMLVYFSPGLGGISLFASPTMKGSDKETSPAELAPESGTDLAETLEVSLDAVREVQICREQFDKGTSSISGLLFQCKDGSQACVGKFRFDHAKEVVSVADSTCFYLGTRHSNQENRVLVEFCLSKPENKSANANMAEFNKLNNDYTKSTYAKVCSDHNEKQLEPVVASKDEDEKLSPLQKHVQFWDRDNDGIINPWDVYYGFRELGFGLFFSIGSLLIPIFFSYPTRLGHSWLPDPLFRIYVNDIHKAKHGSDTGIFDFDGNFSPERFEQMFQRFDTSGNGGLTAEDLWRLWAKDRCAADPAGWTFAFMEWWTTYVLLQEDGVVKRDDLRACYDGSLFWRIKDDREKSSESMDRKSFGMRNFFASI
ncbi:hypothetical protein FPANT_2866 [Fusarium pseudoanthophilum]|uniref:EF-hand domain-containing protein n=1 Tax=Fusarium pseudoanthophilum TaxID=48495 RepID=A0A8H5UWN6_9HYPO|nr:hypothetical protein FPANT_2866 [Fusarium pseudoanthophilum]